MNEQSAFNINEESHEKIVKENEEEKRKELKRKKTNARQRAYYQRQKDLKKNEKIIKTVPKSNAERQRKFRQRNAEKSYMDICGVAAITTDLLEAGSSSRTGEEEVTCNKKKKLKKIKTDTPPKKRARKDSSVKKCSKLAPDTKAHEAQPWQMSNGASSHELLSGTSDPATSPTPVEFVCIPDLSAISDAYAASELSCDGTTAQLESPATDDSTYEPLLDEEADESDEDLDVTQNVPPADFLTPTNLSDYLEEDLRLWLCDEDKESDRLLQQLLPKDQCVFDWSRDRDTFTGQREHFKGKSGPTFLVTDTTKPVDIFLKIFDDPFFDLLISQANKYATLQLDLNLSDHSRLKYFTDLNKSEIACFLAILILQSCLHFPAEKNYWSENGYFTLSRFKEIMPFNKFALLKRLLNFSDLIDRSNMTEDEHKLKRIQPVLDIFNEKFSSMYFPEQTVYIDDSLLKWKKRLSLEERISSKATKRGIKSYELCESATGYLWKFCVYTEKTDRQTDSQLTVPTGAPARILNNLVEPLLNVGHTLVMDNFYNSPLLARYLKSKGTDCFGSLRVNRGFVPEYLKLMLKSDMQPLDLEQSFTHDLSVLLWRDTNLVSMISTYHAGIVTGKCGRNKSKPQAIVDYDLSMKDIDKKDQLLSAFPIERARNQGWHKKVFRRLLNYAIINAFIIFKTCSPNTAHRNFRIQLAEELIKTFQGPRIERSLKVFTLGFMDANSNKMRPVLSGNHFMGNGPSKRAVCVWCHKSRTRYICKQCDVALCLQICFEQFHTVPHS